MSKNCLSITTQITGVNVDKKSLFFRLGKPRQDISARPILVKSTEDCAADMMRSTKKLKTASATFKKAFIDKDYPPEIANALSKLRKKAFDHRQTHPNCTTSVRNGKLYFDGIVVDQLK